jgi:chromosome partitioning protein
MSKDGYKVLAIDMDSQGNLTELLTNVESNEFIGKSVLEAIVSRSVKDYIVKVNDHLDVLPANNFLALLPKWLYTYTLFDNEKVYYTGGTTEQLYLTIEPIIDQYDFILIDTPPSLSEQTTNSLVASDYVIVPFESSYFCLRAIPNFIESVEHSRKTSKRDVQILGVLRTLNDKRRSDSKLFNETIADTYPELVFKTIITRKASTGRLPLSGFDDNQELGDALEQFRNVYVEIKERLGLGREVRKGKMKIGKEVRRLKGKISK